MIARRSGKGRFAVVAACALAAACGPAGCGAKPKPAPAGAAPIPPSTLGQNATPISDEELDSFAKRYVAAMTAGDLAAISRAVDLETLSARSLEGVPLQGKPAESARKGVQAGLTGAGGLVGQVKKNLEGGGSYRLLRVHDVDGGRRVLLRLLAPEAGVNYHDVMVSKGPDGTVRAIDMHVFLTGELISETMKRVFLPLAAKQNQSLLDRLAGREQAFVRHFDQIASMTGAVNRGVPAEAIRAFRALPTEVQREKVVLIMRLRAAADLGDDAEYDRAIEDFRTFHPTDKCIEFLSIDYYFARKEFDNVRRAIDQVDEAVGGDPYLQVMRGNAFLSEGRTDDAARSMRQALAAEPDLQAAWWALVAVHLERKAWDDVLATLREIDGKLNPDWQDLRQAPLYKDFVQTPQYRQWVEHLARKTSP